MGVGIDCIAEYVHPFFLYESLWNLLGLLMLFAYMDSRKFKGELFLLYTVWYGIGRAWMEPLRDSAYNLKIFGLRVNMVLAIVVALAALATLLWIYRKKPARLMLSKNTEAGEESPKKGYEAQFDYAMEAEDEADAEEEEKNG